VRVTGLDHVVLIVDDVERTLAWYHDELGLEVLRADEWRAGELGFPSLRVSDDTIIDVMWREPKLGRHADGNVDHICLVVEPMDLEAFAAERSDLVVKGPVPRWGARGDAWSVYLYDPDGFLVELRHYGETPQG
jgi:catechol 2,3-dioxygenase-like lactoylglutathione lyase family enzyme